MLYIKGSDCCGEMNVDDFAFESGFGGGAGRWATWLIDPEDFVLWTWYGMCSGLQWLE